MSVGKRINNIYIHSDAVRGRTPLEKYRDARKQTNPAGTQTAVGSKRAEVGGVYSKSCMAVVV